MGQKKPAFEQIDHTADAGIIARGADEGELFVNAARGLFDMIADLSQVESSIERTLSVEASDKEALLVNWLSELNYLFLTERELYNKFEILEFEPERLSARISGEELDLDKHEIHTEVKAVTYHQLYVKETEEGWEAQVIFDL